jgi:predicted XRE-type DNA-binding protein
MARKWKDVRAEAVETGLVEEHRVAKHRKMLDGEAQAYRLAQVRKAHDLSQTELAKAMKVSQSRVSKIERGELARSELGTLESYVEALGGELKVIADFGDEQLKIS